MHAHRDTCNHHKENSELLLKQVEKISLYIKTDKILQIQFHLLTHIPALTQQMWTAAISLPLADYYILLPSALPFALCYCFQ